MTAGATASNARSSGGVPKAHLVAVAGPVSERRGKRQLVGISIKERHDGSPPRSSGHKVGRGLSLEGQRAVRRELHD